MNIESKKAKLVEFIQNIRPDIKVMFSSRGKWLLGRSYCKSKKIQFYKPLFAYTLESCLECAIHEVAHIFEFEISGDSNHGKNFKMVKDMLMEEFGSKEIAMSNRSTSLAKSTYTIDNEKI
jgi:predicted SprT family Zn-dependent metalloprotease